MPLDLDSCTKPRIVVGTRINTNVSDDAGSAESGFTWEIPCFLIRNIGLVPVPGVAGPASV